MGEEAVDSWSEEEVKALLRPHAADRIRPHLETLTWKQPANNQC